MGKSTISIAIFNSYVSSPEGKSPTCCLTHYESDPVGGPGLVGADAPENVDAAARRETIPLVVFLVLGSSPTLEMLGSIGIWYINN